MLNLSHDLSYLYHRITSANRHHDCPHFTVEENKAQRYFYWFKVTRLVSDNTRIWSWVTYVASPSRWALGICVDGEKQFEGCMTRTCALNSLMGLEGTPGDDLDWCLGEWMVQTLGYMAASSLLRLSQSEPLLQTISIFFQSADWEVLPYIYQNLSCLNIKSLLSLLQALRIPT